MTNADQIADEPCPRCDDSGFEEFASGGIWTGENITTRHEFCDCICGQHARDEHERRILESQTNDKR